MKNWLFVLLAVATSLLMLSMIRSRQVENRVMTAAATPADELSVGNRVPVVVELFTSEGCSSCPPADALLTQLIQMPPVPGAEIIALSEHVDYWNYIGWIDPFSSPTFSARQQAYAESFRRAGGRGDVYTPQMVVDGQFEFIGSHANRAREAIAKAISLTKANVQIAPVAAEPNSLKLRIQVSDLPPLAGNDQAEVLLALTENNLASNVVRGENSGRKLRHNGVTRELRVLGPLDPAQKSFTLETPVKIAAGWKRAELRAVAFVQERVQGRILGAASCKLSQAN